MKTVLTNTKRFLAVFLAMAMVVLALPQTAVAVKADTDSVSITPETATISGVVGDEITSQFTAAVVGEGAVASSTSWALTDGVTSLPAGLSGTTPSATYTISGKPEAAASGTSTLTATNGGKTDTATITWEILAKPLVASLTNGGGATVKIGSDEVVAKTTTLDHDNPPVITVTPALNKTIASVSVTTTDDKESQVGDWDSEEGTYTFRAAAVPGKQYEIIVTSQAVTPGSITVNPVLADSYTHIAEPTIASGASQGVWDKTSDVVLNLNAAEGYQLAYKENAAVSGKVQFGDAAPDNNISEGNLLLDQENNRVTVKGAVFSAYEAAAAVTAKVTLTLTNIVAEEIPVELQTMNLTLTGKDFYDVVLSNDGDKAVEEAVGASKTLTEYDAETYDPTISSVFSISGNNTWINFVKGTKTAALYVIPDGDVDLSYYSVSGSDPVVIVKDGEAGEAVFDEGEIEYKKDAEDEKALTYTYYGIILPEFSENKSIKIVATGREQTVTVNKSPSTITWVASVSGNDVDPAKQNPTSASYGSRYAIKPTADNSGDYGDLTVTTYRTSLIEELAEQEAIKAASAKGSSAYAAATQKIEELNAEKVHPEAADGFYAISKVTEPWTIDLEQKEKSGRTVTMSSGDPAGASVFLNPTKSESSWTLGNAWENPSTNNGSAAFGEDYSFVIRYEKNTVTNLNVSYNGKNGIKSLTPVLVTDTDAYTGLYSGSHDTWLMTIPKADLTLASTSEPIKIAYTATKQYPISFAITENSGVTALSGGEAIESPVYVTASGDYAFTLDASKANWEVKNVKGSITGTAVSNIEFGAAEQNNFLKSDATYTIKKEAFGVAGATGVTVTVTAAVKEGSGYDVDFDVKNATVTGNDPTFLYAASTNETYTFKVKVDENYAAITNENKGTVITAKKAGVDLDASKITLGETDAAGYQTISISPEGIGALAITVNPALDAEKASTVTLKDKTGNYVNAATSNQSAIIVKEGVASNHSAAFKGDSNKLIVENVYNSLTLEYDTANANNNKKPFKITKATVSGNDNDYVKEASISEILNDKQDIVAEIPDGSGAYSLVLETEPLGLSESLVVSFENLNSRGVSASVDTTATGISYADGLITADGEAPYVKFAVTPRNGYAPSVQVGKYDEEGNFTGTEVVAAKYTTDETTGTRTYTLVLGIDLTADLNAIQVNAAAEEKAVRITGFDPAKADLTVVRNNVTVVDTKRDSDDIASDGGITWYYDGEDGKVHVTLADSVYSVALSKGDKVSVKITPKATVFETSGSYSYVSEYNYVLLSTMSYQLGSAEAVPVLENGTTAEALSTTQVTLSDNLAVTVVLENYAEGLQNTTTTFNTEPGAVQFAGLNSGYRIFYGVDNTLLPAASIDYTKSLANLKLKTASDVKPTFANVAGVATLTIPESLRGNVITLPVYGNSSVRNSDGELGGLIGTYSFNVLPSATGVTLAGISAGKTIQLAAQESGLYKASMTPSTADIFAQTITVKNAAGESSSYVTASACYILNGKSYVPGLGLRANTYIPKAGSETDEEVSAKNTYTVAIKNGDTELLSFKVEVTPDVLSTSEGRASYKPQVSVSGLTDVSATISASLPKGKKATAIAGGNALVYRVSVQDAEGKYIKPDGTGAAAEATADHYQYGVVVGNSSTINEKAISFTWSGLTAESNYTVKVRLQREDYNADPEVGSNFGTVIGYTDDTVAEITTNKHVYPSAMTLTKVNNTVYDTNDEAVPVGKVVLDKGALTAIGTVDSNGTQVAAGNVTVTTDNENVDAYVENGVLYAKYNSATKLSAKTTNVTITIDPDGALVAKSIKVTVARGVESVNVATDEVTLAKVGNKAATYTITPILNSGDGENGVQPQSVKYTYSIVESSSTALTTAIGKINNGKVTVPAKYAAKDGDYFIVEATAADKDGKTSASKKVTFYLKTTAALIDQPAVAIPNENGGWDIYKSGSKAFTRNELWGASIVVLGSYLKDKKATPLIDAKAWDKAGHYYLEDQYVTVGGESYSVFIDDTDFTYTPTKFSLYDENTDEDGGVGIPVVATGEADQVRVSGDLGTLKFGSALSVKVLANDGGSAQKTLSIKTAETVLPVDASIDKIAFGTVDSGTGDTLIFSDAIAPSEITVTFKDKDGNPLDNGDIYKYTVTSKSGAALTVTDEHQVVNTSDAAGAYYQGNGGFKAYMKKGEGDITITYYAYVTNAAGKQVAKAQKAVYTLKNTALSDATLKPTVTVAKQPTTKIVDGAQTVTMQVTTTNAMLLTGADHILYSLPADYYDTKTGAVKKANLEAAAFVAELNDKSNRDGYTGPGDLTVVGTKTETVPISMLTKTTKFKVLATIVNAEGNPLTGAGEVEIVPTALKKFVAPKTYTVTGAGAYRVALSEGSKYGDGEGNNVIDGAVYPVYTTKSVKQDGKTVKVTEANKFADLFTVTDAEGTTAGSTYLSVDLLKTDLIEEYLDAVLSASTNAEIKAVKDTYLTGYVKIHTDTMNPSDEYLTKVTVTISGTQKLMTEAIKAADTANNAQAALITAQIDGTKELAWSRNDWTNDAEGYEALGAVMAEKAGLASGYGVKVSKIEYSGGDYHRSTVGDTGKLKVTYNLTKDGAVAEVNYRETAITRDIVIGQRIAAGTIFDRMLTGGHKHTELAHGIDEEADLNAAIQEELTAWLTDTTVSEDNKYFYAAVEVTDAVVKTKANGTKYITATVTVSTDAENDAATSATKRQFSIADAE